MKFLSGTCLKRQNFGTELVVIGIQGENRTDILERYYSFYNNKATNGEFYWLNDGKFGYFFTSETNLLVGVIGAALNFLLNDNPDQYKGREHGVIKEATAMAVEAIQAIPEEMIIFHRPKFSEETESDVDQENLLELTRKTDDEILELVEEKLC